MVQQRRMKMKIKFWNIFFILLGIVLSSLMIAKIIHTIQFANKYVTSLTLFDAILFASIPYLLGAILLLTIYWVGKKIFIR